MSEIKEMPDCPLDEEWRPVVGFDGYQVSNYGRVRSLDRLDLKGRRIRGKMMSIKRRKIRGNYRKVWLAKDGKDYGLMVHRLVAFAFIPLIPGKEQVNHKDGDTGNNHVSNLEWVNNSENNLHAYRELNRKPTNVGRFGRLHPAAVPVVGTHVVTGEQVRFDGVKDAERHSGFTRTGISDCLVGKCRTHRGYRWEREGKVAS